jgi:hypothetical protein
MLWLDRQRHSSSVGKQLSLDYALQRGGVGGNPDQRQARVGNEALPPGLGPLQGSNNHHHREILSRGLPVGVRGLDHDVVDDNPALPWDEARLEALENLLGVLVGPVVEHGLEIICTSALGRVRAAH